MSKAASDEDMALVDKAVQALREHFDSVQIFVTRREPSGTVNVHVGGGNWYANYGFVKAWIMAQEAIMATRAIEKDQLEKAVDEEED